MLDLQSNAIGVEGARYISDALRTCASITKVNLNVRHRMDTRESSHRVLFVLINRGAPHTPLNRSQDNNIKANGALHVSEMLHHNSSISSIYLSVRGPPTPSNQSTNQSINRPITRCS